MVSEWNWCNVFFRFPNGEMVKLVYGVMVIWWNFPMVDRFFGTHFHRWRNGEMVTKINNIMNGTVRFNFGVGYQLYFSLFDFLPARQWCPSWQVWGISPVLSLVSADLPHILLFRLFQSLLYQLEFWWKYMQLGVVIVSYRIWIKVGSSRYTQMKLIHRQMKLVSSNGITVSWIHS